MSKDQQILSEIGGFRLLCKKEIKRNGIHYAPISASLTLVILGCEYIKYYNEKKSAAFINWSSFSKMVIQANPSVCQMVQSNGIQRDDNEKSDNQCISGLVISTLFVNINSRAYMKRWPQALVAQKASVLCVQIQKMQSFHVLLHQAA